jgi:hypothetical protein
MTCGAVRQFHSFGLSNWLLHFLSDELAYRRLYLILTIQLDRYDAFVKKIEIPSPAYEVLRKAVFERQIRDDHFERHHERHVQRFGGRNASRSGEPRVPRYCPGHR